MTYQIKNLYLHVQIHWLYQMVGAIGDLLHRCGIGSDVLN